MQTAIDLPQAFSVRDENEFYPIQHLLARLNSKLIVTRVATGRHVHGGPTVVWGVVHVEGKAPSRPDVEKALERAGFDMEQCPALEAASVWGGES